MPLSVFASAIEEGLSISIAVDESLADFTVDGQFNGSIDTLLNDLYERYGISHIVNENGYKLWRDSNFYSEAIYQFQLSDMGIVMFLNYLSQATGFRLIADTSMNIDVNGAFNGTLQDIINALSNQYPVLFHMGEGTVSIVPESSFVKKVILISNNHYSSEALLTDLRTKLSPGNFVNRQDNQLIVGGHPEFVKLTLQKIQADMSASASTASELVTAQFPVVSDAVSTTLVGTIDSMLLDFSAEVVPLVAGANLVATTPQQDAEVAQLQEPAGNVEDISGLDAEATVLSDPDDEAAKFSIPSDEAAELTELTDGVDDRVTDSADPETKVTESPEYGAKAANSSEPDTEVAPTPDTTVAATPKLDVESEATATQEVKVEVPSEQNTNVDSVDQIPGFY